MAATTEQNLKEVIINSEINPLPDSSTTITSRRGVIYNLKLFQTKHVLKLSHQDVFGTHKLSLSLPASYFIPVNFPPYDQGSIGSCTANAGCATLKIQKPPTSNFDPSRLFLYYVERSNEGGLGGEGAVLSDTYLTMQKTGVCSESTWPYNLNRENVRPSAKAYNEAAANYIQSWGVVPSGDGLINGIKQVLVNQSAVIIGIVVYESFESDQAAQTGVIPMPNVNTENALGGHAITIIGYDDNRQAFLLLNSWGPNWGTYQPNNTSYKGFCYLPYAYVADPNLCDECYFFQGITVDTPPIVVPPNPPPPPPPPQGNVPDPHVHPPPPPHSTHPPHTPHSNPNPPHTPHPIPPHPHSRPPNPRRRTKSQPAPRSKLKSPSSIPFNVGVLKSKIKTHVH